MSCDPFDNEFFSVDCPVCGACREHVGEVYVEWEVSIYVMFWQCGLCGHEWR